jgi:plasmid stabilization system protein ParE
MYSISYSKLAEIDLEDAIEHIAKTSTKNALEYLLRYEDKIELLKLNPQMGTECMNKLIKRDCRVLVHESHIIIYSNNKKSMSIFIIRIYHGSVDYAYKFNREMK